MTDLHTHILPAMDDGSWDVAMSLQMLRLELEQGVDTVCLTPHFSPAREKLEVFLERRERAMESLMAQLPPDSPKLLLGAEVAWFPTLLRFEGLEKLSLDGENFLLELPFQKWTGRMLESVYQLTEQMGLMPILAHVERYVHMQDKGVLRELFGMGLPMQMNASSVLEHPFHARSLLKRGQWFLGSDCHNLDSRPPDMGKTAQYLYKKWGTEAIPMLNWQPE